MSGRLLETRVVNAFIADASPATGYKVLFPIVAVVLWLVRKMAGGLWVGGTLSLFENRLLFEANRANRLVHHQDHRVEFRISDVRSVTLRPGFLTKIVDIVHAAGTLSVRACRAETLAASIRHAVRNAKTGD